MIEAAIQAYLTAYRRAFQKDAGPVTYAAGWFQVWHGVTHHSYRANEFASMTRRLARKAGREGN